jgi:ubiquinone/menaquinone biosynthesis C-methylase UbiE
MPGQYRHDMLCDVTHDENSRQDFVSSFKSYLSSGVSGASKDVYLDRVEPAFTREHNRPPKDRHEVRRAISGNGHYQMSSSLKRTAQEMMFDSVGESVERQLPALINKAGVKRKKAKFGTLRLDPKLQIPRYHTAVDIHCMPGGYHTEIVANDDVYAGALYDRSIFLFSMGIRGVLNDDFGQSVVAYYTKHHPDLKPKRILDIGCSVGHGTLPHVDAFPDAEVYAIDVGAPMLRYGHARTEALGKRVHFSQQNAEQTDFPDHYFDLVMSQIVIHETSHKALPRIMRECKRILKPGGLLLHVDGLDWKDMSPYDASVPDWDTYYNAEPFIGGLHDTDYYDLAADAGFDRKGVFVTSTKSGISTPVRRIELKAGDFGNVGSVMVFGARA